jgi:mycofactocin precursor
MDATSFSTITTHEDPGAEETFTPVEHENIPHEESEPQEQAAIATIIGNETEMEEVDEIEEELIIEDFTIDGICGVY